MADITWGKYEKKMKSGNIKTQRQATDAFIAERKLQTKTSLSAKRWEEDRKKELAKNKPLWVEKREEAKKEQQNKSWNKLFQAGVFDTNLSPAPGYVLIGLQEVETEVSGIIIANQGEEPNEGIVLEVGEDLVWEMGVTRCPCSLGDKILFKRGAGLNIVINDKKCKLIYFPDILGTFNEN